MQVELSQLELRYERLRIVDPTRQARLVSALLAQGQQSPVVVVPAGEPHRFVLIEGYGRVAALRQLASDTVEAVVLETDEVDALVLGHRLETARRRTALEEGWLVQELVASHGLEQRDVARRLERSPSWVSRRLALVTVLPAAAQDAVRAAVVPAHAATKCLVPLTRVNREHCERLIAALEGRAITERQLERLYVGWRRADSEARERIVSEPWLYLRTDEAMSVARPVSVGDPVEPLLRELEAIAGLSGRSRRRVADGLLDELEEPSRRAVRRTLEQAERAFSALLELLGPEVLDARPGDPHGDLQAA